MSSKGRKDSSERALKLQQLQRDHQRRERRRAVLIYSVTGGVVLLLVGAATFGIAQAPDLSAVRTYKVSPKHVTTPVKYPQSPPAGGKHNPIWLNCGSYGTAVPSENAVHSMEDGAVWVTYRPDLPAKQVAALKTALPSTYAVLSPFPGLKAPVVASAWGRQLVLDGAEDKRLGLFFREYVQGAQAPESGAACTGGTDGSMPLDAGAGGGLPAPNPADQPGIG